MLEPLRQEVRRVIKTCARCGRRFGCGHGEPGCWCEAVLLRPETLAAIRAVSVDCLCPTCLAAFAEKEGATENPAKTDVQKRSATSWAKALPHAAVRSRGVSVVWGLAAVIFLVGSLLGALAVGPAQIGPASIIGSVLSHLPFLHISSPLRGVDEAILWQVRGPRVILAALVGGMPVIAGSAYQGVFRNPLADPYLLGVAAGAGLGATLAVVYLRGVDFQNTLPPAAFGGGAIAVVAAYAIGRTAGIGSGGATLILAGVTVAAFFTAVQTFVQQEHSD